MSQEENKGPNRYRKRNFNKDATCPDGDLGYRDYIEAVSIAASTCAMTACSLPLAWTDLEAG